MKRLFYFRNMQFEGTIKSKFPEMGTTIFSIMTNMAREFNAINLSQGFPEYQPPAELVKAFKTALDSGNNQYAPMAGWLPLREAIAEKTEALYSLHVSPETEVTITAGATQAIYTAISALVHTDDEVLVFAPAYDSYVPAIELAGGNPVFYTLEAPHFKIDWQCVKKLISHKTKMIILNTPHNPTATILEENDWIELEKIVRNTNIVILSDEVYEHIVFDGQKHQSILQNKHLASRSIVVFSFGKTYHATGWKVGYVIAPENLMAEFRKVHQYTVFSVSTPAQIAYAEMLKERDWYIELSDFYEQKRNLFYNALNGSRFDLLQSKGTYFQLASYQKISDKNDMEFTKWLVREKGVATIPISVFYPHPIETKIIRFCFAKENETLQKAAECLNKI